ncbi:MAG: thiazole synthase [Bacteroidetes bacterium]|nr:thiazole synthase [Bacteroidota bacterium]
MNKLKIADTVFDSRLFVGTGKFGSSDIMKEAVIASGSELVTVALKRVDTEDKKDDLLTHLKLPNVKLLPNTAGVRTAKEAVFFAKLAREALETNWIKLEVHPDSRYLLPDHIETLKAAEELSKLGFIVLPYVNADPVLCKHMEEAGVAAVMPLGSPIGSNKGLRTKAMLEIIIDQAIVPVVVDAGIGAPSHASEAMEMGADAVLVNTAIAVAADPVVMAEAFNMAVKAGRLAYESRLGIESQFAQATSPITSFLEQTEKSS